MNEKIQAETASETSKRLKKIVPTKIELAQMEAFTGLTLAQIYIPATQTEFKQASDEIMAAGIVGFDTESRPTFVTGDVSEGPHVVQFALHNKAFLFQLHHSECLPSLGKLLQSQALLKVGFGLKSDYRHIRTKLGVQLGGVVDLNTVFSMMCYPKEIGVRSAVGVVFKQRFAKSRKVTTSNWSQPQLSSPQILYAANDAYAALRVLEALNLPSETLPIMNSPLEMATPQQEQS